MRDIKNAHAGFVQLLSHLNDFIFSVGDDNIFRVWDLNSGLPIERINLLPSCIVPVASSNSLLLCIENSIILLSYPSKQIIFTYTGHTAAITSLVVLDNNSFFSTSNDMTVRRWSLTTGAAISSFATGGLVVRNLCIYQTDKVIGTSGTKVRIWLFDGSVLKTLTTNANSHFRVLVTGDVLVSGTSQGLRLYNLITSSEISQLHTSSVRGLSIDRNYVYSSSLDGIHRAWNRTTFTMVWETAANAGMFAAVSNDLRIWIGKGADIHEYDITSALFIRKYTGHSGRINQLQISGPFLFSAALDLAVRQWNINSGGLVRTYTGGFPSVFCMSPNFLITSGSDRIVRVFNTNNGQIVRSIANVTEYEVYSMDISRNLVYIGTTDPDNINVPVQVWDWTNGSRVFTYRPFSGSTYAVRINNDELFVADGRGIGRFDTTTRKLIRSYSVPIDGGPVCHLAIATNYIFGSQCVSSANAALGRNKSSEQPSTHMWNKATGFWVRSFRPIGDAPYVYQTSLFLPNGDGITNEFHVPELRESAPTLVTTELPNHIIALKSSTSVEATSSKPSFSSSAAESSLSMILILGATGTFCGIVLGQLIVWHFFRYMTQFTTQNTQTTLSMSKTYPQDTTAFSNAPPGSQITSFATESNRTAVTQSFEISIPAFMELRWGLDFVRSDFVAKGGGGAIYRALCLESKLTEVAKGEPLVVKEVGDVLEMMNDRVRDAFFQEVALMWRFRNHPNFVRFYGYSIRPVTMVMKYYALGDLHNLISGGRSASQNVIVYSRKLIISLARQICDAVGHMHSAGVVHCDIKPANVLIDQDIETKIITAVLTDFGISRIVDQDIIKVKSFAVSDLRGASIAYSGPEAITRFHQRRTDDDVLIWKSSDVYALSITFFELMIRRNAWHRRNLVK